MTLASAKRSVDRAVGRDEDAVRPTTAGGRGVCRATLAIVREDVDERHPSDDRNSSIAVFTSFGRSCCVQ